MTHNDLYWAILARVEELYPCQAIPYGGLARVGDEFGVTREYVRQITNAAGITKHNVRQPKPKRACPACGREPLKWRQYCEDCRNTPVVCDRCGVTFRRHVRMLFQNASNPSAKMAAYYCSVACKNAANIELALAARGYKRRR